MGIRNYLVEGVSGTGKTTVCDELNRRGIQAIHGDRVLAYQGDPVTGAPTPGARHEHHIWDLAKVRALIEDRSRPMTFLCGGSRNFTRFIDLLDGVFLLDVDADTLDRRLRTRGADEFGATEEQRALVHRLHATGEDTPRTGIRIDTARPVAAVVDDILARCG